MKSTPPLPRVDLDGVGRRLEALREALGLTRKEFAESFGLDASSYTKTAAGEKALRSEAGFIISERWGVSMDFLYRGRMNDLPDSLRQQILASLNGQAE
ncbi:helix-turn-helix domain-containing protein [Maritimibacter alexandrii]|uniref:helix-turn-helix domain-containing protein n=1 Tax=Maritimibacter alexandrii TaxID=2570355 RepID=UPI00148640E5|nr:helix-turn-helix transcriptional regulator [Maritimibacter alexandrii]